MRIETLDTTLRDGAQAAGRGVFSSRTSSKSSARWTSWAWIISRRAIPCRESEGRGSCFDFAREKLRLKNAQLAAFGMTLPRGRAARRKTRSCEGWPLLECGRASSPVSWARPTRLAGARRAAASRRRKTLRMISQAHRRFWPRRQRHERCFSTRSTSSTATAKDPAYALATLAAAVRGGRDGASCCATPTAARCPAQIDKRRARGNGSAFPCPVAAIHCAQRRRAGHGRLARRACAAARRRCRAPSTAMASAAATPTCARCCPTWR